MSRGLVFLGCEEVDWKEAPVLGEKCCTAKLAPKGLVEHGTISLEEWLEVHGPITRPGRCIPCEGSERECEPGNCPRPHGEADLGKGKRWEFSDAVRPYHRTPPPMGFELCMNMDLLSAMNDSIRARCTEGLRNAVRFIEAELQNCEAKNVLSQETGTMLTWHDYGVCSGAGMYALLGNSLLFGQACGKRQGKQYSLSFVWNLEDTAKAAGMVEMYWVTARSRWDFSWNKGSFSGSCTFHPPPPPHFNCDLSGTGCGI